MNRTVVLVLSLALAATIATPLSAAADPEAGNHERYPLDGLTPFVVGEREIMFAPGPHPDAEPTRIYTDVDSEFPVLYKGFVAEDVEFAQGTVLVTVPAKTRVVLYRSGALKETREIATETVFPVSGANVVVGTSHGGSLPLTFHENGMLENTRLVEDTVLDVQGRQMLCTGYVRFDSAGVVEYCGVAPGGTIMYRGTEMDLATPSSLSYHPGGALHQFTPRQEVTIPILGQDVAVEGKQCVWLHENENVSMCWLAECVVFSVAGMPVEVRPGQFTSFHEDGSLASGCLASDTIFTVGGREILFDSSGDYRVSFHPDGSVESGYPAEPVVLDYDGTEITVYPGPPVYFDENGALVDVHR